jgi:transposase
LQEIGQDFVCDMMELNLEDTQLDLLRELQRNTSDRLTYQRLTTLVMLHKKLPISFIADTLGVDATTIYRHIHQYDSSRNFDSYLETHYKPCVGKLTDAQKVLVQSYVRAHICHSSLQVLAYIKDSFGVEYKPDSVIVLLHRLGFVYKKTKLVPSKANIEKQEQFITEFREIEKNLPEDELILFGDGVHPHHNTESTYAWIEKGTEKEVLSNTGRVRVNINGAINPANPCEVVYHKADTINSDSTIVWLSLIESRFLDKKVIHLFVDNARYYRSKEVQKYLETSRIKMHFLPPYSPNLNPIERLWRFLKKQVIKSDYTPDPNVFRQRIDDFFNEIHNYKEQLKSLINTNFQKLKSTNIDL